MSQQTTQGQNSLNNLSESIAIPALEATPTPVVEMEQVAVLSVAQAVPQAQAAPTPKVTENYQVIVRAPANNGILAYLVGPGAEVVLQDIDLNTATTAIEGSNLRISLPTGGQILLLDFVPSAASPAGVNMVTSQGTLPAQTLLAALESADDKAAEVEPAAGRPAAPGTSVGEGGFLVPTIIGDTYGVDNPQISSVIDPFAIGFGRDFVEYKEYLRGDLVAAPANSVDARDDSYTLTRNAADSSIDSMVLNVLANDVDPQGDTFTITGFTQPAIGTIVLNADGTFTYTADASNRGAYETTFTYTITDSRGATDTATVTVRVGDDFNNVDARDDSYTLVRDAANNSIDSIVLNVLVNDVDPQGDTFTITGFTQPAIGTVTLNADGTFTYTADNATPDAYTTTFTYTITDSRGATDTATVTVRVGDDFEHGPNNAPPLAVVDRFTTEIDTPITITPGQMLVNDSDPNGDPLTIVSVQNPVNGTFTRDPAGNVIFTPAPGFTGLASYSYTITDGNGGYSTAEVQIEIAPVTPQNNVNAVDDTATIVAGQNIRLDVEANDFDPQGDAFDTTLNFTQPSIGSVVRNADGSFTYTSVGTQGYTTTFTYEIRDARGATDTATVTINVLPATNSVVAEDDSASLVAGQTANITVVTNDYDPQGDTFRVSRIVSGPAIGTAVLNGDGTITYTSVGTTAYTTSLVYEIIDARGAVDTATVYINVTAPNTPPNSVIAENDTANVIAGDAVAINVLANDSDPQGDTFTITRIVSQPDRGSVTINADGTITYQSVGTDAYLTEFVYEITDSKGATDVATVYVRVEASPFNNVDARDDSYTLTRNTADNSIDSIVLNVLANDVDPQGDAFSITGFTQPAIGSIVLNADGTFTYTADASREDAYTTTFTYTITDSKGATDTATVTINVGDDFNNVDARDDSYTLTRNLADNAVDSMVLNVLANDVDPQGDTFRITGFTQPAIGTVTLNADGTFTYTADAGQTGAYTTTFTYTITDEHGATDTATVTLNVGEDYKNTVDARDDVYTLTRNAANNAVDSMVLPVLANDVDPEGDTFRITGFTQPAIGTVTLNADGTFTYTADASRTGAYDTTFTYTITDARGATDTATVTVKVGDDFNNVDARDDVYTLTRDTANNAVDTMVLPVLANDVDPQGDAFSITGFTQPGVGSIVLNANGTFTYTADAGRPGAYSTTFTYTITDSRGATDTATVTINVGKDYVVPNSVDARDDSASVTAGQAVAINVLANDVDPQGDAFGITRIVTGPGVGSAYINASGQIVYQSVGRDPYTTTLTYEIRDARGATDIATVTIYVGAAPNNVDARDDSASVNAGSAVRINVLANDVDPQGDAFGIIGFTQPSTGRVTLNSDGTFTYQSSSSRSDYDVAFTYTIRDSRGAVDTATVYIHVNGVRTGGIGGGGSGGGGGDCPLTIDLDGDGFTIIHKGSSNANFDLNGDGVAERTAWVGPREGILVRDYNGDGVINGIDEAFGNKDQDGFTELRILEDTNNDGIISKDDAGWSELRVWVDSNGDGISQQDELFGLDQLGIESIDVRGTKVEGLDAGDAYISHLGKVNMTDGSTRDAGAIWYRNDEDTPAKEGSTTLNPSDVLPAQEAAAADSDIVVDPALTANAGTDVLYTPTVQMPETEQQNVLH